MTDKRVEDILKQSMPGLCPDERLNRQIIEMAEKKKKSTVHAKRLAVAIVACCLLLSSMTVGAATICYIVTVARAEEFYTKDYRKINVVEAKAGYDIKFLKEFENGFFFDEMGVRKDTQHAMNKSKEVLYTEEMMMIDISYAKGEKMVMLSCYEVEGELTASEEAEEWSIAGTEVFYEYITIEADELSCTMTSTDGTGEVEHVRMEDFSYVTASWIQKGVCYHFMAMQEYVTKEDVFSMVEELILCE